MFNFVFVRQEKYLSMPSSMRVEKIIIGESAIWIQPVLLTCQKDVGGVGGGGGVHVCNGPWRRKLIKGIKQNSLLTTETKTNTCVFTRLLTQKSCFYSAKDSMKSSLHTEKQNNWQIADYSSRTLYTWVIHHYKLKVFHLSSCFEIIFKRGGGGGWRQHKKCVCYYVDVTVCVWRSVRRYVVCT